jgi:uncharacterized membrane protein YtjA (UPF0391 family)
MLKGAVLFLLIGVSAALLGFTPVAGGTFAFARVVAGVFLFMFLMLVATALFATRAV